MPNVYLSKRIDPSLRDRTVAAWPWSRRQAVVAGLAAAAMHGARWVDGDTPVELIWRNARAPKGVLARDELLFEDKIQRATDFKVPAVEELAAKHRHARGVRQLETAISLVDCGAESPRDLVAALTQ